MSIALAAMTSAVVFLCPPRAWLPMCVALALTASWSGEWMFTALFVVMAVDRWADGR